MISTAITAIVSQKKTLNQTLIIPDLSSGNTPDLSAASLQGVIRVSTLVLDPSEGNVIYSCVV